jgi:hypothetical protein
MAERKTMDENNVEENVEEIKEGFVPVLRADGNVTVRESGSLAMVVGGNATLDESGCGMLIAGGDVTIRDGGGGNLLAGGNVSVINGGAGNIVAGGGASVADSRVGVLLTPQAKLENSEVILSTQHAVVLGLAAGATLFVLGRLLRRR